MNFCKDCKYLKILPKTPVSGRKWKCKHKKVAKIDPVFGIVPQWCGQAREDESLCGKAGRYFKKRKKK